MRQVRAIVVATAWLILGIACAEEPLCCVEVDPGEPIRALTCEDEDAVLECERYNFSDCYWDTGRDDDC